MVAATVVVRTRRLLSRDGGPAAAQNELLNLPGGRLWQLGDEAEAVRAFEMRQLVPHECPQLLGSDRRAGFQYHERVRRLAPLGIRQADDCRFKHSGMVQQ